MKADRGNPRRYFGYGVPPTAIRFDGVVARISLPTETCNLIVDLPGTAPSPRRLFSTHLDTVPFCAGAKLRREGDRIVSDGTTALGGDNRTGCSLLVTLVAMLMKNASPSADVTSVDGVRGERPVWCARA